MRPGKEQRLVFVVEGNKRGVPAEGGDPAGQLSGWAPLPTPAHGPSPSPPAHSPATLFVTAAVTAGRASARAPAMALDACSSPVARISLSSTLLFCRGVSIRQQEQHAGSGLQPIHMFVYLGVS